MDGNASTMSMPVTISVQRCILSTRKSILKLALKRTATTRWYELFEREFPVSIHVETTQTEYVLNPARTSFVKDFLKNIVTLLISCSLCLPISSYALLHYLLSTFFSILVIIHKGKIPFHSHFEIKYRYVQSSYQWLIFISKDTNSSQAEQLQFLKQYCRRWEGDLK